MQLLDTSTWRAIAFEFAMFTLVGALWFAVYWVAAKSCH